MKKNNLLSILFWKNKRFYFIAFISTFLNVIISFTVPFLFSETIDVLLSGHKSSLPQFVQKLIPYDNYRGLLTSNLWIIGIAIIILNLLDGLFSYLRGRFSAIASENISKDLRDKLFWHIQHLPYAYHVRAQTGDLIQRCTSDVETIRRFLAIQMIEVIRTTTMLILAPILMLQLDAQLTLFSVLITPAIFLFSFLFYRRITVQFKESDESEGRMSTILQENLATMRVVRAFGRQNYEVNKFDKANADLKNKSSRLLGSLAVFWGFGDTLSLLQIAITLLASIAFVSQGKISLGTMFIFYRYVLMLLFPIRQLGRILSDAGKAKVSMDRLNEILHSPLEPDESTFLKPSLVGDIVFENVSFWYEKGNLILDNLSFTIPQGQTVAFLGPTGSGKSTLISLLQRLYEPKKGRILIGGVDIKNINRFYLRSRVGLILQESYLYSKTLGQNIGITNKELDMASIQKAAKDANAHDFIEKSLKGYDTIIGERGVTLSGGQKQRIAIARTLLKSNDIIIFDDSLSAVDTHTDIEIRKNLVNQTENLTTIIISHRLSTLSSADIIFVLEKGKITAQGDHSKLLETSKLYGRIFGIQTSLEEEMKAESILS